MNIDKYLDRVYNERNYNCAHFVCEVWNDITGQDISILLAGFLRAPSKRWLDAHKLARLTPLDAPETLAIALFQSCKRDAHVGIWLDGKILHIGEKGVELTCIELLRISFNQVRFYDVKKSNNC